MEEALLKEIIRQELPQFMLTDPSFRAFVLRVSREEFVSKAENESRFDRVLAELQQDREEQKRLWAANEKRWQEYMRQQDQKHDELRAELKQLDNKVTTQLGALGARWGTQSETSFRNALAGVLTESFGVEVLHFEERDTEGTVFGRPDQVEIDILVRNGTVIVFELKSSIDKGDVYLFERKCQFYARFSGRTVNRMIMVSPYVRPRAEPVFAELGVECYSDADEVPLD